MAYKVLSASAYVKDEGGSQHLFYENDVLPDGLDKDHLKHLLDLGFIEEEGKAAKADEKSASKSK